MRWQGGRRGGGIEDRRGMGGGAVAGGGIGVLVLAADRLFRLRHRPQHHPAGRQPVRRRQPVRTGRQDAARPRIRRASSSTSSAPTSTTCGQTKLRGYTPPTTVLYEQGTATGCGFGQSAMGPFYCPTDQKVYLDLGFWREMETKLGASGADFAKAYVIAHEIRPPRPEPDRRQRSGAARPAQASSRAEGNNTPSRWSCRPTATPASGPPTPPPCPAVRWRWSPAIWRKA